jgi:hypothetical protein
MVITFQIPDELADSLTAAGDLPRRALEGFALEELRAGRITEAQLCEMLGALTGYDPALLPNQRSTIARTSTEWL